MTMILVESHAPSARSVGAAMEVTMRNNQHNNYSLAYERIKVALAGINLLIAIIHLVSLAFNYCWKRYLGAPALES